MCLSLLCKKMLSFSLLSFSLSLLLLLSLSPLPSLSSSERGESDDDICSGAYVCESVYTVAESSRSHTPQLINVTATADGFTRLYLIASRTENACVLSGVRTDIIGVTIPLNGPSTLCYLDVNLYTTRVFASLYTDHSSSPYSKVSFTYDGFQYVLTVDTLDMTDYQIDVAGSCPLQMPFLCTSVERTFVRRMISACESALVSVAPQTC